MNVYKFNPITKEYTGVEPAMLDPLESKLQGKEVYLLPANATFTEPTFKDGYANVWNGEAWEQTEDNREKQYWLADDIYGAPAREMKELGAFPADAVFTAPEKMLSELKQEKINALKAERDSKEVEPIVYQGCSFDYDDKARDRINAAIIALELQGDEATISWTTADNRDAIVTAADLRAIVAAVAVRSNLLHIAYRKAKAQVEAAGTAEEVRAICME
ncbi:DUF4376 domain-containing protein [Phascolarctobacterium succinatutens]|uniref:DUF4376 domain-containing protein n=1 Tax=Phascolarctobacterium succinatutens TaxID=626940 RepID=UPI0026754B77|nr:DUF4376 domain-containing protein [Phascolarctobacterium succinatutens]